MNLTKDDAIIIQVLHSLNMIEAVQAAQGGFTHVDPWHAKERAKYIALDIGNSGAFLVERATGELFNIKGYGKPDRNKKAKADLGNIQTVDTAVLLAKRWNYLI